MAWNDLKAPQGGGGNGKYLRLKNDGDEYRIRILAEPFVAQEAWKDNKPVRKPLGVEWDPSEYDVDSEARKNAPREFWAMPVWNTNDQKIQVWSITQPSIMGQLEELVKNADWGAPTEYDIKVKRDRDKKNFVTYTVTPVPPRPLSGEVKTAWEDMCAFGQFDLSRLIGGGDPFGVER